MKPEMLEALGGWIDAHREEMLEDLSALARIPSVEGEPAPGAPFGTECRRALDAAVALFEKYGFAAEVCSEGKYGLAHVPGGENTIGIFGHLDVVPVTDDWILTKPFEPAVHDGCLIGRGVHDDKAGVIMTLYALRAARDLGISLNCAVEAFLGANEETGMQDIDAFVAEQPMPTVSLVPDNEYPVCLGEKGICHLWVRGNRPLETVRSIEGGIAANVILDNVTAVLDRRPGLAERLGSYCRGKDAYTLTEEEDAILLNARGITAHGSAPEGSVNALKLLLRALTACPEIGSYDRAQLAAVRTFLEDDYGRAFGIVSEDPHFGRTTATNGMVRVTEGFLALSFDIRYGTTYSADEIEKRVQSAVTRAGFTVFDVNNRPGFSIPEDEPDAMALIGAYRQVSGDSESRVIYSGGGTYARHLRHAFSCGCEAPYLHRDLGLPQGHGGLHQSDEAISVDGLIESVKIFAAMLIDLDETYKDR